MTFVQEFYRMHLKKYGKEDIRSMGWHHEEEYPIRFELAMEIGDLNNSSILDVGCGFGGLYKFLVSSEIKNFSYLGIDILPEMIQIANQNSPTGKFALKDILKDRLPNYDYIFCIGSLNITPLGEQDFFMRMVRKMVQMANKGVFLNFLSDSLYLNKTNPYNFQDPKKIEQLIKKEFKDVKIRIIKDERLLGESCMYIYKTFFPKL